MGKDLSPHTPRHASEPTHDDTFDLARELGVHPMHAYGHISAFRARYPIDSPHGRFRGGERQVEALALWDGQPGMLAAAFERVGIIDRVEGELVAHDHDLYAGASLRARQDGAKRTAAWREKKKKVECDMSDRHGDASPVTSPSLLLTHSGSRSDPDPEIANPVPSSTPMEASKPRSGLQTRRLETAHGQIEAMGQPKTPAEVLAHAYWGKQLREKFPALLWSGATQTLIGDVTARFGNFQRKYERDGKDAAYSALIGWIAADYGKHEQRWRQAGAERPPEIPVGVKRGERPRAADEIAPGVPKPEVA